MQVEIARLAIGGGTRAADGTIVTEPGTCWLTGNPAGATSVAALRIRAEHLGQQSTIRVVPQTQQRQTLIDSKLAEDGTLNVTMTPDGAAALPFFRHPRRRQHPDDAVNWPVQLITFFFPIVPI